MLSHLSPRTGRNNLANLAAPRGRKILVAAALVLVAALSVGGCPEATRFDFPTEFVDVNRIVGDANLSPQEQRELLRLEGLSDSTINAFLRDERLGNQFGGDLTSAFNKITLDQFADLTPDEVQSYGDAATAVDSQVGATLNDANAQAIVNLFRAEDIDNADELAAFLAEPSNVINLPDTIPDGVLQDLFVDFDPERVRDRLP